MVEQTRPFFSLSPSTPFDSKDLPRFGQIQETVKDAFMQEITDFFNYSTDDGLSKISELPNIQKFSFGGESGRCGLETVVNMIMAYGDTLDKFPMVSITSSSLRERKMNLGTNFVSQVQYPARIVGTKQGPFDLTQVWGDPVIRLITTPNGSPQTSTIMFSTSLFPNPSSVSIDLLIETINKTQALYYTLSRTVDGFLAIEAGGVAAPFELNSITIDSGNSYLMNILGLTDGQTDDYLNIDNPLKDRFSLAADMVINIDVICDSLNTRTELSDLVYSFFGYYLQKKLFQFYGRSYFDRTLENEWYHIVLKNQFSWNGEINKPRQGGEQYEHVYAIRGSVPIYVEDFIDKTITDDTTWVGSGNIDSSIAVQSVDITGDYFGMNYKR